MSDVSFVVIGRNEGERLRLCLESVLREPRVAAERVCYVDSGSTDGSVELAKQLGVTVAELDLSRPFSAARARNEGYQTLRQRGAAGVFVHFIDGDCELILGWVDQAVEALEQRKKVAAVCGRRREQHRETSIYNRLCDLEWDTPVGDGTPFGGDVLIRCEAFEQVDGYDANVIAAEDRELALRLEKAGWIVTRLDADMTNHDARMRRFIQWWRRAERTGHCYAQGAAMHGAPPTRHFVRESRRVWVWGLALPVVLLALIWPTRGLSLLGVLLYLLPMWRTHRYALRRGWSRCAARQYAWFCTLGKFPELLGMLRYHVRRLKRQPMRIIEYQQTGVRQGG